MSPLAITALLVPFVVGLAWTRILARPRPTGSLWFGALADAYLLGYGWVGASLTAALVVGAPLHLAIAWPIVALPVAIAPLRRRRAGVAAPVAIGRPERAAIIAISTLLALHAARALLLGLSIPLIDLDSFAIWGLKAITFFKSAGLDPSFFTVDRDAPMHPDYPLVQPMFGAWLLLNHGTVDERILKTPFPFIWLCLVITIFRAARRWYRPAVALGLAAAVGFIDTMLRSASVATADLVFATLLVRGAIDGRVDRRSPGVDPVAIACLALAVSVKNEGWAALIAVGLGAAWAGPGALLQRVRGPIYAIVGAVGIAAPWLWFRARHGLYNDLWHGAPVFGGDPAVGPVSIVGRIGYVLGRWPDLASQTLFDGVWIVIAALALPIALAFRVGDVRRLGSTALLLGAAYVAALASTPHNIEWHVATATPRLLQHLAPLWLLAAFAAAAHFLAPVAPRIIQR